MARKMTKWPSKRGPISKIGHRMAAEGMQFSWRWNGGTITLNLGVIWGMPAGMSWPARRGSIPHWRAGAIRSGVRPICRPVRFLG